MGNKTVKQTKALTVGFTHVLVMAGDEVFAVLHSCKKEEIDMPVLLIPPDEFNKIFYLLKPISRFEYGPLKEKGLKTLMATDRMVNYAN
jgi:hypothetical protein